MVNDEGLPARLRLPDSFAESGDPSEGNPFPPEHPAYQVWIDATREAELELSRINSEAPSLLTLETAGEWMLAQADNKFDVWCKRFLQVVWTDDAVRCFDRWLVVYANAWMESLTVLTRLSIGITASAPTKRSPCRYRRIATRDRRGRTPGCHPWNTRFTIGARWSRIAAGSVIGARK